MMYYKRPRAAMFTHPDKIYQAVAMRGFENRQISFTRVAAVKCHITLLALPRLQGCRHNIVTIQFLNMV